MPRAHALLVESIHQRARDVLSQHDIEVSTTPGGLDADGLVSALNALPGDGPVMVGIRSKTKVTAEVIGAVPRLAAIGAFCIGTDQIDLAEARRQGIAAFNAPFANTRSVAELVVAEIVMLSRQIFPRSQEAHRGRWAKSAKGAHEVRGKTLGIVGYGHIGSQLSVLAESMGMAVQFYDVVAKLPLGNARACASLEELLSTSDFISFHVPDTPATRSMMGAQEIAQIKHGSYLINASRGTVVDLEALRGAVLKGAVAGAAIDVYPAEPAKEGDAFETPLRGLDQVILTPHIGGSTQEAQANIGHEVGTVLSAYFSRGVTVGSVNLPELDPGKALAGSRVLNLHENVPGVLSQVNRVVAESGINITGQSLSTRDDVGFLIVDLDAPPDDTRVVQLEAAIAALATSRRTWRL